MLVLRWSNLEVKFGPVPKLLSRSPKKLVWQGWRCKTRMFSALHLPDHLEMVEKVQQAWTG